MIFAATTEAMSGSNPSSSDALRLHRRHCSREGPRPFAEVDQCQHGIGAVGVFCQSAVAYLGKAPNALEPQKWVFDFCAHGRLSAVGLPILVTERAVPVSRLVGEVFGTGGNALELLALVLPSVSTVPIDPGLLTVQQVGQLLAVVHIARQ